MSLFVPFWWSPRIYFIHMDEVMGGWRVLFLRVRFEREWLPGVKAISFKMRFACGIGAREKLGWLA